MSKLRLLYRSGKILRVMEDLGGMYQTHGRNTPERGRHLFVFARLRGSEDLYNENHSATLVV
ncbi:MAG: hypothetical protein HOH16_11765 [Planctomycetaceae bacterium]|nr:hypothetical protein [Planctomycetaceae bacterium]